MPYFAAFIVLLLVSVCFQSIMFRRKKWNPQGKHCFITGGSSGSGLALAILLAKKGAHVSIVARDETKLAHALEQIEAARQHSDQVFQSFAFSLNHLDGAKGALEAACAVHVGRAPDGVFTCAGSSRPSFFVEQTEQLLLSGMENAYWVQAWTALAAAQKMVKDGVQGRIVFVSSTLGLMSFVGYSSYAPGKHALKGLAETLRSELLLYGISVHCFFPCTIYTPGYEEENKTKPKITLKIEEADSGLQPEQVAEGIFKCVEHGHGRAAGDLATNLFLASNRGISPSTHVAWDVLMDIIAWIGTPIFRRSVDANVRQHQEEHMAYLKQQGFFE